MVAPQDFALNQLERDLGGCREAAESFFPFPLPPGPGSSFAPLELRGLGLRVVARV